MLDIKLFRETPDVVRKDREKRGIDVGVVDEIIALDQEWRNALAKAEEFKHKKNSLSQEVATLKKAGKDASSKISDMSSVSKGIDENDRKANEAKEKRDAMLMRSPNILHESVPVGKDDSENAEVRTWGKPVARELPPHGEILEKLGFADFDRAGKAAGAGFYYLKGDFAILDYALQRFAIDKLAEKGFTLIEPPFMMNRKAYEGVTDLGDFESVMYKIDKEDLYLIATSEHPIGAMLMNDVLDEAELPLKFIGVSTCFRKEIGSHGVDTRGIFRVHQFNKVEQFVFCKPEESWKHHDAIVANAEEIFRDLELPYHVVNICTGDIGTVAAKKFDIEVWSPRQKKYTEVVSASNCTDYQARRLNIKYGKRGGEKQLVHTLNSTAIATSRALVAIVENFYEDGVIKLPKAIRPYMNGKKEIGGKH
jgi:seryl-tRNA synthetase